MLIQTGVCSNFFCGEVDDVSASTIAFLQQPPVLETASYYAVFVDIECGVLPPGLKEEGHPQETEVDGVAPSLRHVDARP